MVACPTLETDRPVGAPLASALVALSLLGVACGSDQAVAPDLSGFALVSEIVQGYVNENGLNGASLIVVDRDAGVLYQEHFGEFGPGRISLIASSSKMIAAGVLMRLHDDGLLDIDAPVADVVDWGSGNPDVTPAQLISNSSGLPGVDPINPIYFPHFCMWVSMLTALSDCAATIFTTPDDDADVIPPDTEFRYGGGQWQVAGAVAEVASGKTWAELVDEIFVQPCSLEATAFSNPWRQYSRFRGYPAGFAGDPSTLAATDNPSIEGGAYTTLDDYAKLLLMHLRDGMCGDNRVHSTESLERMHEDRIGRVYDGSVVNFRTGKTWGYGMGWWYDRDTGRISDPGLFGSMPWLDLDDGYGAYLVLEATSQDGNALYSEEGLPDAVHEAILTARG